MTQPTEGPRPQIDYDVAFDRLAQLSQLQDDQFARLLKQAQKVPLKDRLNDKIAKVTGRVEAIAKAQTERLSNSAIVTKGRAFGNSALDTGSEIAQGAVFLGERFGIYAVVGLAASIYSPAKYGILTEYLPPTKLVLANGWIEGLTVASIILGTALGGALINPGVASRLLGFDVPFFDTGLNTPAEAALCVIAIVYAVAAVFNLYVPRTGAPIKHLHGSALATLKDFYRCNARLWRDKLGQISLAVTTLFWGVGATLQFIVIEWSKAALGVGLSKAAILQIVVARGVAWLSRTRRMMWLKSSFFASREPTPLMSVSSAARASVSASRRFVSSKRRAFSSATLRLAASVLSMFSSIVASVTRM